MRSVLTDSLHKLIGPQAPPALEAVDGFHVAGFLGEPLAVQIALHLDPGELPEAKAPSTASPTLTQADGPLATIGIHLAGPLANRCRVSAVRRVPVSSPAPENADEHYLTTAPGRYPDLLEPVRGVATVETGCWESLWVEVLVEEAAEAGEHPLTITLTTEDGADVLAEHTIAVRVHPHELPPLAITNTQWFHADSLSQYYGVDVFSEQHWALIETFLASARAMDLNSVLTPTWTPPLDTAEGTTRPQVQLVGIADDGPAARDSADGTGRRYRFDFTQLDRWLEICRRLGFRSLEIAHLFTQWGARSTPAIYVDTPAGLEHRFGWHVAATDPAYRELLEQLIPALREHLHHHWDGRVLWHISDEPSAEQLEAYQAAKSQVADLLEGATVVDALSDLAFAEQGVVQTPIVATDHVRPFLEAGRRPWVYYCVAQNRDVANRFIALPSVRNRVIGRQMFCFDVPGFLHWGYNFWWLQFAAGPVDPFTETCAGGEFFGGDSFAVYPGPDGSAWLSIRHRVFAQAMADHRALTWLASLTDADSAKALVDEGGTLAYDHFSYDVPAHVAARRAVDRAILEALG